MTVDPDVMETGQPYAYTGDDPVNGVDPLGLCTLPGDTYYPGHCATNGPESIAAGEWIQTHDSGGSGILGDIASGIKHYDPFYSALEDYRNEYHAAQDGCSLATVFGFAAKAEIADVETGASLDGEGEVADAVDAVDADLPTLEIDAERMPNIARNVQSAIDDGQPSVLNRTTDPAAIQANRSAACAGFCGAGSPDEYPFASTLQGGAGAQVQGVPLQEQYVQGAVIRNFYAKYGIGDGDPFQVVVSGLEGGG